MLKNLIVAMAYFYFHTRYFMLTVQTFKRPRCGVAWTVCTFLINYVLFYFCSILELNLIVNWTLFFLFFFVETLIYCKGGIRTSLAFALYGILLGLSINIFCRCVVSIVTAQPLIAFDNRVSSVGNLKAIPVLLGFLVGGAMLHLMSRPKVVVQLRVLTEHPQHEAFQLELMIMMFLYLCLNLLLYRSRGNGVLLKIWGIKSCIFSLSGLYLGMRYSLAMCRLSDYREQNRVIQRELLRNEQKAADLRSIAYLDVLTGAYNRPYALEHLDALLQQGKSFVLCFLDVDELKVVNDRYGHAEGDRYLCTVMQALFDAFREESDVLARYGGDEFLLLLPGASVSTAQARLEQVKSRLREMSGAEEYPFSMSISFGVVDSSEGKDANALLHAADREMYRCKTDGKNMRETKDYDG